MLPANWHAEIFCLFVIRVQLGIIQQVTGVPISKKKKCLGDNVQYDEGGNLKDLVESYAVY